MTPPVLPSGRVTAGAGTLGTARSLSTTQQRPTLPTAGWLERALQEAEEA